jgi:GTPase
VLIINHPGKVRVSYEPVVHFLGCCVRQSARIIDIKKIGVQLKMGTDMATSSCVEDTDSKNDVSLVTGDKAICRFRFLYRPEYISLSPTSDSAMVMREGRTKGVGKVLSLGCPSSAVCSTVGNVEYARA